jgi:hypothetical protein
VRVCERTSGERCAKRALDPLEWLDVEDHCVIVVGGSHRNMEKRLEPSVTRALPMPNEHSLVDRYKKV